MLVEGKLRFSSLTNMVFDKINGRKAMENLRITENLLDQKSRLINLLINNEFKQTLLTYDTSNTSETAIQLFISALI